MDSELFCSFFHDAPLIQVPGRTFPVSCYYLEDLMDATNHIIEEGSRCAFRQGQQQQLNSHQHMYISTVRGQEKQKERIDLNHQVMVTGHASQGMVDVSNDYPEYKMTTRLSMDRVNEEILNYDLIEDVLEFLLLGRRRPLVSSSSTQQQQQQQDDFDSLRLTGPDGTNLFMGAGGKQGDDDMNNYNDDNNGSILIFLPGLGEIRTLTERLKGNRNFFTSSSSSTTTTTTTPLEIIPMHSSLSSQDQKRAFVQRKWGSPRKIILSTNIAETSITIPDVVCGKGPSLL